MVKTSSSSLGTTTWSGLVLGLVLGLGLGLGLGLRLGLGATGRGSSGTSGATGATGSSAAAAGSGSGSVMHRHFSSGQKPARQFFSQTERGQATRAA